MPGPAVCLDARWLRSGIGRYTHGILRNIKRHLPDVDFWCVANTSSRNSVSQFCDKVLLADTEIYTLSEQLVVPWLARQADIFHAPHYNAPIAWSKKLVVTIHDLNHILDARYRNTWKSKIYSQPLLKYISHRADRIITVSEYSRTKIMEHLHVESERISVIGCSVAPIFHLLGKEEISMRLRAYFNETRPYCLFVGDMRPNKNLPLLLHALSLFRMRRKDVPRIVFAGGDNCGWEKLFALAAELGVSNDILWLPTVSDDVLVALYGGAEMTIMPSLEEGFGLPVIESMSCGTPVLCANAASLPEIAGGAALLFDPYSPEDLFTKIEHVLDSTEVQQRMISLGLKRASSFTVEKQAILHSQVYCELLGI